MLRAAGEFAILDLRFAGSFVGAVLTARPKYRVKSAD